LIIFAKTLKICEEEEIQVPIFDSVNTFSNTNKSRKRKQSDFIGDNYSIPNQ
jgi:hypothetical protein